MPSDTTYLCGGVHRDSLPKSWLSGRVVRLSLNDNVTLKITDITRPLLANLSEVDVDLLEIAAYVYVADQNVSRGGLVSLDYGNAWRRTKRMAIPVRRPDVWSDPATTSLLRETLEYLTDDFYDFEFRKARKPHKIAEYMEFPKTLWQTEVDAVMLFSGGLDSLAGAVQQILVSNQRVALVSHRPCGKLEKRQKRLLDRIREIAKPGGRAPQHICIKANKDKSLANDYGQRARSFLYAAFAAVVARAYGLAEFSFFENGIISINLPWAHQAVGARATRTTHPRTLAAYEALFGRAFGLHRFKITNPFITKTKTDVVKLLAAAGCSDLSALSVSCAHTWVSTTDTPHCGACSQCLDRRMAMLGAGVSDDWDPPRQYQRDPVLDGCGDPDVATMTERYVGFAHRLQRISDAPALVTEFGELLDAIPHLAGPMDAAAELMLQLHKRHAGQVIEAINNGVQRYATELSNRRLPPDCLLMMNCSWPGFTPGDQWRSPDLAESVGRESQDASSPRVAIDRDAFALRFGQQCVPLGNGIPFQIIAILLKKPGRYVPVDEIKATVWPEKSYVANNVVARHVGTLRRVLKEAKLYGQISIDGDQKDHYACLLSSTEDVTAA